MAAVETPAVPEVEAPEPLTAAEQARVERIATLAATLISGNYKHYTDDVLNVVRAARDAENLLAAARYCVLDPRE